MKFQKFSVDLVYSFFSIFIKFIQEVLSFAG